MNAEVFHICINFIYIYIYDYICMYVCMLYSLQVSAHFIFSEHMLLVIGYDVLKNRILFQEFFMPLQQRFIILSKEVNVYSLYICKYISGVMPLKML